MMSLLASSTCYNCRWFLKDPKEINIGSCKLFPPTAVILPTPVGYQAGSISPAVKATDWCGQYEPTFKPLNS